MVARILVDVTVTAPGGEPVTGLSADDFAVTIDGSKRPVLSVDVETAPAPAPASAAPRAPQDPETPSPAPVAPPPGRASRTVALVFHLDGIAPLDRHRAVLAARRILRDALAPADRVAVVTLGAAGPEFLVPFTAVGRLGEASVPALDGMTPGSFDPFAVRAQALSEAFASCRSRRNGSLGCFQNAASAFVTAARADAAKVTRGLSEVASAMAPLPGTKVVVLFSDGLVATPGRVISSAFDRYDPALAALMPRLADPPMPAFGSLLSSVARDRVSFYCWRTGRGLDFEERSASHAISSSEMESRTAGTLSALDREALGSLQDLAAATGGRVLAGRTADDVDPSFLDGLAGRYTLAVEARADDGPRSKVKVRLTRARGAVSVFERVVRRASGPPALPGALTVEPAGPRGLAARAVFEADGRVAVYASVLDGDGRLVTESYATATATAAAPAAGPGAPGARPRVELPVWFELPPGRYVIELRAAEVDGPRRFRASAAVDVSGP